MDDPEQSPRGRRSGSQTGRRPDTDDVDVRGGVDGGVRRGADIGAILSALPLMWVALGVTAFAATRLRLPLPPLRRMPRAPGQTRRRR